MSSDAVDGKDSADYNIPQPQSEPSSIPPVVFTVNAEDRDILQRSGITGETNVDDGTTVFAKEEPGTYFTSFKEKGKGRLAKAGDLTHGVVESLAYPRRRSLGHTPLGSLLKAELAESTFTPRIKRQRDYLDEFRPYFSIWITIVHVVIFVLSVTTYGITEVGFGVMEDTFKVRLPTLKFKEVTYTERKNIWIGPSEAYLILLGARYSPCMRPDPVIAKANVLSSSNEKISACCIRHDGTGCLQSPKSVCNERLVATWYKWTFRNFGPNQRTSGPVCGLDPRFCESPAAGDLWPDDIIKWPICDTPKKGNFTQEHEDQHMQCQILSRPCCIGLQGQCIMTSWEHCDLLRGTFHTEAHLCSQVYCLKDVCGMSEFVKNQHPDQFYRLWTSLFLHKGWLHLFFSLVFQLGVMRDLEMLMGPIFVTILFLVSGVVGNMGGTVAVPLLVETGPMPAHMGITACLIVEILQNFQLYKSPLAPLKRLGFVIVLTFLVGLLPLYDNWSNLFGFIMGFQIAFVIMPHISFSETDKRYKIVAMGVCSVFAVAQTALLTITFIETPIIQCAKCSLFSCFPFSNTFCPEMVEMEPRVDSFSAITPVI